MNRSVLLEEFPCALPSQASLTVATSWAHPRRGTVRSPAHPVLTSAAHREHIAVQERAFTGRDLRAGPAGALLVTVSYEDPRGGATGLAMAVRADDSALLAFAREQILLWRSVLRTRRVLLPDVSRHGRADATPGPVPAQHASRWSLCGCPATAGCPAAADATATVRAFQKRGDQVLLVGLPLPSPTDCLPLTESERASLLTVTDCEEAAAFSVGDPARLAFVVAPGAATEQLAAVLAVLRERVPGLRGQHPSQWCYTMTDWWLAAETAVRESDRTLLLGSGPRPSPGAIAARTTAALAGTQVHTLASLEALRPEHVNAWTLTLLDAGAQSSLQEPLVELLGGLGPCDTVHRVVGSRHSPDGTHGSGREASLPEQLGDHGPAGRNQTAT
ncbi:hypothetical protein [Streptomyces sp. A5-4]|uniref:hypothetical protein n=1 Tax=Streptomyces sp. A5-4 TaxID=3384771 RepID=UPI003DA9EFD0